MSPGFSQTVWSFEVQDVVLRNSGTSRAQPPSYTSIYILKHSLRHLQKWKEHLHTSGVTWSLQGTMFHFHDLMDSNSEDEIPCL